MKKATIIPLLFAVFYSSAKIITFTIPHASELTTKGIFTYFYETHFWNGGKIDSESVSGSGSTLQETKVIREKLPELLKKYKFKKFIDAPCGDFNWMKEVDLSCIDQYIGLDVVAELIKKNQQKYASSKISFAECDITVDSLPEADVFLCRDCVQHLPFKQIISFIKNLKKSKTRYLLATTYTATQKNDDIDLPGGYYPINLQKSPFSFPKPLEAITEKCEGKTVCLWRVEDLPDFPE
jgi:hypothetical protein